MPQRALPLDITLLSFARVYGLNFAARLRLILNLVISSPYMRAPHEFPGRRENVREQMSWQGERVWRNSSIARDVSWQKREVADHASTAQIKGVEEQAARSTVVINSPIARRQERAPAPHVGDRAKPLESVQKRAATQSVPTKCEVRG